MVDRILEFADQFPVVEYGPNRPEPPQVDLTSYLIELLEIAGYAEAEIHRDVEKEIPDDAYEPTDIDYTGSITFPAYLSEDKDDPAHIVGYGQPVLPPLSEHGLDHADYEKMRVHHEVAGTDKTICLTPFDLLVYEGQPLFAGDPPRQPFTSYPLHEDPDSDDAENLLAELEPPSDLS